MAFFRDQLFNILQIKIQQRQIFFPNNADLKKKVEKTHGNWGNKSKLQ